MARPSFVAALLLVSLAGVGPVGAGQRFLVVSRGPKTAADEPSASVQIDDWIVQPVSGGKELRFSRLSGSNTHCGRAAAADAAMHSISIPATVVAVAASGATLYAAQSDGAVVEFDARDPAAPRRVRRVPHAPGIRALAADAKRLYLLGAWGLEVLDLESGRAEVEPAIRGRALTVAGRKLSVVTDEGELLTIHDVSRNPLTTVVSVNSNAYQPQNVTVATGDTVQWVNVTGDFHNVLSCTATQVGCGGVVSAEPFSSGSATGLFVYDHTFTSSGMNPYICQPHAPFMIGSVTVTGGSGGTPPGVPDGSPGTPITVAKLTPDGSSIAVAWDTATCGGALDTHIVYGYGYQLPGSTGGGYELSGSRCSVGASPYTWAATPLAFSTPTGFLWWLVVASDGATTEGAWGNDGSGSERVGPGANGASLECGITQKSLSNSCGH